MAVYKWGREAKLANADIVCKRITAFSGARCFGQGVIARAGKMLHHGKIQVLPEMTYIMTAFFLIYLAPRGASETLCDGWCRRVVSDWIVGFSCVN